jgi:hypothetical protein
LKPERWGSLLVQEKYQEEKACDKRHPYRIIIMASSSRKSFLDSLILKKEGTTFLPNAGKIFGYISDYYRNIVIEGSAVG